MPATAKTYSYDAGTTTANAKGGSAWDPVLTQLQGVLLERLPQLTRL